MVSARVKLGLLKEKQKKKNQSIALKEKTDTTP